MRIFLVILGGFALTLTTFASGVLVAIVLLTAEPVPDRSPSIDTAELWTNDPAPVNAADQNFERLPRRPVPRRDSGQTEVVADGADVASTAEEMIDTMTTASVASDASPDPESPAVLNAAHLEWCSNRYRSYRSADNTYTPYSGGQRECISPLFEGTTEDVANYTAAATDRPYVGYATNDEAPIDYLSPQHVRSCFNRYRSYRPEDNSYQPYGGGPRRQCR